MLVFEDGLSRVLMIENHLQHISRLNIHVPASAGVVLPGSGRRIGILQAWVQDPHYCNAFQTNSFCSEEHKQRRIGWENELWNSAYAQDQGIDGDQAPKYAGLNLIPQPNGLDEPPGSFAFGDCFLQLKQHMLERSTFCLDDSGSLISMHQPIQLATIDTILVALQSATVEIPDDALCKMVHALTDDAPEVNRLEYQVEAQIHSLIFLAADVESIHLPEKYCNAQAPPLSIRNQEARHLDDRFGLRLHYF